MLKCGRDNSLEVPAMKRERLKRIKRHQKRGFVYKPRGLIHRSKRLCRSLARSASREVAADPTLRPSHVDPGVRRRSEICHAISFMTERGTVVPEPELGNAAQILSPIAR